MNGTNAWSTLERLGTLQETGEPDGLSSGWCDSSLECEVTRLQH